MLIPHGLTYSVISSIRAADYATIQSVAQSEVWTTTREFQHLSFHFSFSFIPTIISINIHAIVGSSNTPLLQVNVRLLLCIQINNHRSRQLLRKLINHPIPHSEQLPLSLSVDESFWNVATVYSFTFTLEFLKSCGSWHSSATLNAPAYPSTTPLRHLEVRPLQEAKRNTQPSPSHLWQLTSTITPTVVQQLVSSHHSSWGKYFVYRNTHRHTLVTPCLLNPPSRVFLLLEVYPTIRCLSM